MFRLSSPNNPVEISIGSSHGAQLGGTMEKSGWTPKWMPCNMVRVPRRGMERALTAKVEKVRSEVSVEKHRGSNQAKGVRHRGNRPITIKASGRGETQL